MMGMVRPGDERRDHASGRTNEAARGSLVDVRIIGVPLIVNGKQTGTFGIYEDITERGRGGKGATRAEEKYRRHFRKRCRRIFRIHAGMAVCDGQSRHGAHRRLCFTRGDDSTKFRHRQTAVCRSRIARDDLKRGWKRKGSCRRIRVPDAAQGRQHDLDVDERARGARCQRQDRQPRRHGRRCDAEPEALGTDPPGHYGDHSRGQRDGQSGRAAAADSRGAEQSAGRGELLRGAARSVDREILLSVFRGPLRRGPASGRTAGSGPELHVLRVSHRAGNADFAGRGSISWRARATWNWWVRRARHGSECRCGRPRKQSACWWCRITSAKTFTRNAIWNFCRRLADRSRWRSSESAPKSACGKAKRACALLIEQLPAVLWTVDKNLRFTSAVGSGLARLGLKPNQIVGMSLSDYFETTDQSFTPIAAHLRAVAGDPVTFPGRMEKRLVRMPRRTACATPQARCRARFAWRWTSPTASSWRSSSARRRRWKPSAGWPAESRTTSITC